MSNKYIPNSRRAVITGKIATIHNGKRVVRSYNSGEPLVGKPLEIEAPPFTGYVRGFGEGKRP